MEKKIIQTIQSMIDLKKEFNNFTISDKEIKKIIDSFLHNKEKYNNKKKSILWRVEQHFIRKYNY